mmetsp:Transcript_37294/g.120188  ORF Transcript_37294/g.120188 Transcript_37294/m.120188 type:complete len:200 (-) Transcript_37294:92-691(-)
MRLCVLLERVEVIPPLEEGEEPAAAVPLRERRGARSEGGVGFDLEPDEAGQVGRVVAVRVEAAREEEQVGAEGVDRGDDVAVEGGEVLVGRRAARERHVDQRRLELECRPRLRVKELLCAVQGGVEHVVAAPRAHDLLGAVAVVQVPVDDGDAAHRGGMLQQGVLGGDGHIVEQAEALAAPVLDQRRRRARALGRRVRR